MSLQLAPECRDIADKLIEKYPVGLGHIELDKILFVKETEKTPKKRAEIRKVIAPYTIITEYKFIITYYEAVNIGLTDAQKIMVIYHELLHIDVDFAKLRRHNVQDFRELVSKYGVNWDIDPNLPNILDDNEEGPIQNDDSTTEDLEDDEPEVM
jgi:predicted metallopeptidase